MRQALAALCAAAALVVGGCGTVCNFAGGVIDPATEPRIYGGVLRDLEVIGGAVNGSEKATDGDPRFAIILVPLAIVDPVLSFAGDTLTLPVTVYIQEKRADAYIRDRGDAKAAEPPPAPVPARPTQAAPAGPVWNTDGPEGETGKPGR